MEGTPGTRTPDSWISCLASSTVDIQPGLWSVTKAAQDGDTYIDMVCRGTDYANAETCEELAQILNSPLEAGKCYRLEMYMAFVPSFGVSEFRNPINVRVSAGLNLCSRDEEIVTYESIDNAEWERFTTYFSPGQTLSTIWLEGQFVGNDSHFGHVLIDNLSIEEVSSPPTHTLTLCEGESANLTAFTVQDAQGFDWSTGETGPEITVATGGTYTVDILLGECTIRETFEVSMQAAPQIVLTTDQMLCPGEEVILDATTPNADYLWQNGSSNAQFTATDAGTYSVFITVGDCTTSHTTTLLLDDCTAILEMPNAFTPNGDGKNDLFTPIRAMNIAGMQTVIYNRWGENIYTSKNLNIEWDGNLPNGEPAPSATYYWRIRYTDLYGESFSQKGTVSLLK